ncbi:MAG: hypothetical protein QM681_18280 [Novosphingobium sp.]
MTDIPKLAAGLTKAQKRAIYPGPGNPDYARARSDTMFVLYRKGIIRDAPLRGGSMLTNLGKEVRRALAAQHEGEGT